MGFAMFGALTPVYVSFEPGAWAALFALQRNEGVAGHCGMEL